MLEFKAINPLRPIGGTFELHGNDLPADASLWFLLEQLKFTNSEHISILDSERKKVGKLGFEELMAAFYQQIKNYRHEWSAANFIAVIYAAAIW